MKNDMNENSEILSKVGRRTPYVAPEGYFEQLPKALEQRVATPKVTILERIKPLLYFAAVFVGFYVVIHFAVATFVTDTPTYTEVVDAASANDSYYNYVMQEVDENVIIDYLLAEN